MYLTEQIEQYRQLGCTDLRKCSVAQRFVNRLRKVSTNAIVRCQYDGELKLLYVIVDMNNNDSNLPPTIYVPVDTNTELDFSEMERIQRRMQQLHPNVSSLRLAMCEGSGTTLYYSLSDGFKEKNDIP